MVTGFASGAVFGSLCSSSGEVSVRTSLLIERMTNTTPFRASLNEPTPHCIGALQRIIAQVPARNNTLLLSGCGSFLPDRVTQSCQKDVHGFSLLPLSEDTPASCDGGGTGGCAWSAVCVERSSSSGRWTRRKTDHKVRS